MRERSNLKQIAQSISSEVIQKFNYSPVHLITYSTKIAFTLAEVLITLGIIGIIAEATIPTLVNNTEKKQTVTKLQKSYSDLYQVIRLSEIDNGPSSSWNYTNSVTIADTHNFINTYILPYFSGLQFCSDGLDPDSKCGSTVSSTGANYSLKDGVGFSIVAANDKTAAIIIDVNGGKKPNKLGKDVFYFKLSPTNGLQPYGYTKGMTRDQIINDGTFGCTTAAITYPKHLCTALIYYDGWTIADDYPW